ncbi:uncharacterized protein DUF3806 [Serinibacter salmoneus]|uniref:Uncharacterized protein DUF3806 n=1 Tax=Serinibacter salmoneus TaxID=556530 RepID=A0A2A9CWK7_9MICO|nr:DUF3806 domain-containing protein [Serinibacter salmoneus]PFG18526.1 uncharacterized protein DUF3806 [Serinibacter salmoneus]
MNVVSAILADGVEPEEGFKLEALGVELGDALSVMLADDGVPCPWRLVTDEWGITAALHLSAQAVMYPMSMLAKRVEDGETVDVRELKIAALQHAEQVRAETDLWLPTAAPHIDHLDEFVCASPTHTVEGSSRVEVLPHCQPPVQQRLLEHHADCGAYVTIIHTYLPASDMDAPGIKVQKGGHT